MNKLSLIIASINIFVTIGGLFFVHHRFKINLKNTQDRFHRQMLDNLDSKSGWRKTLYEIAGEHNITLNNVQQLRSSLRYKEKEDEPTLSNFDKMNTIIIKYCNQLISNKKFYKGNAPFNFNDSESIRIFCRYLLKDHWEKNHSQYHKYEDENKETELCRHTLIMFLKLQTSNIDENLKDNKLEELFNKANELFDDNNNDDETPDN